VAHRRDPLRHAGLIPGEENSGRLVSLLRREARSLAESQGKELILSDGSPGIGCPVISSLTGAKLAVAVTEPTPSGAHDLVRVAELSAHFRVPLAVIVNKHDLNPDQTSAIERYCADKGHVLAGRVPFHPDVTAASPLGRTLRGIWKNVELAAGLTDAALQSQGA